MLSIWGKGPASKLLSTALGVRRNNRRADVVIRYGIPVNERLHRDAPRTINKLSAIRASSNKYASLQALNENGICVPPFCRTFSQLDSTKIIFGRSFYHSKGTDIEIILPNQRPHQSHDYYIQYLKPRAEYRYHVAFGKVILPTKKILAEGENDDSLIRNHQDGKWRQVVCEITPRFADVCVAAVKALGLDFGAVDFLNVKGEAVVLEINTAPGLEVQNRLDAYVQAFRENL
jgi:glutathione synthase/RimK-type ligase-like ATP-grasp enzyme